MKAIGLNLVMAQAGLYVSSKTFKYTPYTQIFTRILNNDNIFKAQSSFAVEMSELKTILNKCPWQQSINLKSKKKKNITL